MAAGINNVIYMELHSGPKMANGTCRKTIVVGTIDRGSTVYHWRSKVQRWPVPIINIVNWATAITSSNKYFRSFIFCLLFWRIEQTKAVVFRWSEPVIIYTWDMMLQMNTWPNFSILLFERWFLSDLFSPVRALAIWLPDGYFWWIIMCKVIWQCFLAAFKDIYLDFVHCHSF